MIIVSLFAVSCSEEHLNIDPDKESSTVLAKSGTAERDKLLELAQGLAPAIKQYNKYYKQENKFLKKFGLFDRENIHAIKLPQHSEDFMLIVPFASKSLKEEKILIAYYKNGEKQYKIFSKKKYEKKERAIVEEGIIQYLDLIINLIQGKSEVIQKNSILKKNNCYSYTVLVDYYRCTAVVEDSCTGDLRVVYFDEYGFETNDISQGCGDQNLIEIILYVPDESGTNSNPADPIEPVDEPIDPNECDIFDFECNESSGGIADDYRSTLSLNMTALNTSQKNLLNQALSNLINDCLGHTLANSLFGSVNVVVDSTKKNAAEYNPIFNSITFRSNDDIGSTNLGHELFHMYQQQLYGILDDIYNDPGHIGGSNIEFEARAIDMLYPILLNNAESELPNGTKLQIGDLEVAIDGTDKLKEWLNQILDSHANGSIDFLDHFEIHDWFEALTIYKQSLPPPGNSNTDMYNYPINPHLHPEALVKLLDTYFKSNCK